MKKKTNILILFSLFFVNLTSSYGADTDGETEALESTPPSASALAPTAATTQSVSLRPSKTPFLKAELQFSSHLVTREFRQNPDYFFWSGSAGAQAGGLISKKPATEGPTFMETLFSFSTLAYQNPYFISYLKSDIGLRRITNSQSVSESPYISGSEIGRFSFGAETHVAQLIEISALYHIHQSPLLKIQDDISEIQLKFLLSLRESTPVGQFKLSLGPQAWFPIQRNRPNTGVKSEVQSGPSIGTELNLSGFWKDENLGELTALLKMQFRRVLNTSIADIELGGVGHLSLSPEIGSQILPGIRTFAGFHFPLTNSQNREFAFSSLDDDGILGREFYFGMEAAGF